MTKRIVSGITVALILVTLLALAFKIRPAESSPKTIVVPIDYPNIQKAIDAASPGDTVAVRAGHYNETIVISKSLNLQGDNRSSTFIDGGENVTIGRVVEIKDDTTNVNITGFTIMKAMASPHHGIALDSRAKRINIRGNSIHTIIDNAIQIWWECSDIVIDNNEMNGLRGVSIVSGCSNINVSYNTMEGNQESEGINIENNVKNVNAVHNRIDKFNYGIAAYNSLSLEIGDNTIGENVDIGIRMQSCANCTITDNFITGSNTRNKWIGICLLANSGETPSENNTISSNIVENRMEGMRIELPWSPVLISDNIVVGNTFRQCNWGLLALHMNITSNVFYHNNFIDNTAQAKDEGDNLWNMAYPFGGNYWSDYAGIDEKWGKKQNMSGWDMMGDTPYTVYAEKEDSYPLMERWPSSPNLWTFVDTLAIISNSSITHFDFNPTLQQVTFDTNSSIVDTYRAIIPRSQMNGAFNFWIDNVPLAYTAVWGSTEYMMLFNCTQGNHTIKISSEYGKGIAPPINPDVDCNGKVDIVDIAKVAKQFGKIWPPVELP